jgi:hypothetical protein
VQLVQGFPVVVELRSGELQTSHLVLLGEFKNVQDWHKSDILFGNILFSNFYLKFSLNFFLWGMEDSALREKSILSEGIKELLSERKRQRTANVISHSEDFIPLNDDAVDEQTNAKAPTSRSLDPAHLAPWAQRPYTNRNFTLRLHEEILDFCSYVSPTQNEHKSREDMISRFRAVVQSIWPAAEASGLLLFKLLFAFI